MASRTMEGMKRWISQVGQTTSEYMIVVSVISVAAMAVMAYFGDPNSPPQQAGAKVAKNFEEGLTNNGGSGGKQGAQ